MKIGLYINPKLICKGKPQLHGSNKYQNYEENKSINQKTRKLDIARFDRMMQGNIIS